jgi:hypothetical protein
MYYVIYYRIKKIEKCATDSVIKGVDSTDKGENKQKLKNSRNMVMGDAQGIHL